MQSPVANWGRYFLLLCLGAVPHDGQGADTNVGAEGHGEAAQLGEIIGNNGGGDLVHGEAAIGLRNVDRHEAEVAGFF